MKSLKVEDDVHADLILLKRVKGSANMSDLIKLLMELCNYNTEFFERMSNLLEGSA